MATDQWLYVVTPFGFQDPMASLTASEIALAELGAVCLSAAVEAQLALSGAALRAARSQVPQQVPPWEWRRGHNGRRGGCNGGPGGRPWGWNIWQHCGLIWFNDL